MRKEFFAEVKKQGDQIVEEGGGDVRVRGVRRRERRDPRARQATGGFLRRAGGIARSGKLVGRQVV